MNILLVGLEARQGSLDDAMLEVHVSDLDWDEELRVCDRVIDG